VEPLPPIENPLETTQNHEDWVRGQEDFKIRHERLQALHQTGIGERVDDFDSIADGNNSNSLFQAEL